MRLVIVWINTYHLDSLRLTLAGFDQKTCYTGLDCQHLVMDSSLGQQDAVRQWESDVNADPTRAHFPPVSVVYLSEHLGPSSKRNLAWERIGEHTDFVLEIEDDMLIHPESPMWLIEGIQAIIAAEKAGHRCFFKMEYRLDYLISVNLISQATRQAIHPYPSEITGQYANAVEEITNFATALIQMIKRENLLHDGVGKTQIWYDIASQSTNYTALVRRDIVLLAQSVMPVIGFKSVEDIVDFCVNAGLIPRSRFDAVYSHYFEAFKQDPFGGEAMPLIPNTQLIQAIGIPKFLFLLGEAHCFVPIEHYNFLRGAALFTRTEWQSFLDMVGDRIQDMQIQLFESRDAVAVRLIADTPFGNLLASDADLAAWILNCQLAYCGQSELVIS